ncbi:Uncharacterised protein [uncultured archaeon]|nr:Uncharacterised protein [uncultured archaeon]
MAEMSDSEHRIILYSVLERTNITIDPILNNFFTKEGSALELWQDSSEKYFLDLHIPLLTSRKAPHTVEEFEDEVSGRNAYEKILDELNKGGKIELSFTPRLISHDGKLTELTKESPTRGFYKGDSIGE